MLFGGVEIVEDESVPAGDVIFKIGGKEVGWITGSQNASQNGAMDGVPKNG